MWKELITRLATGCEFSTPASEKSIHAAEKRLSIEFPEDLRALLLESDGVSTRYGLGLVWSVEDIVLNNVTFRTNADFPGLYMPFDHLLFFGDEGGGDQYAYRILAGGVRSDGVFQWRHESDSRFGSPETCPITWRDRLATTSSPDRCPANSRGLRPRVVSVRAKR